jgi:hypothetical protein
MHETAQETAGQIFMKFDTGKFYTQKKNCSVALIFVWNSPF